jgi:hypothetical protein
MKQFRFLSTVVLLTLSSNLFAGVFTVNNANPSPGQYNTFAAAVVAASTGDTLMVSGTDISYGNVTMNKALTVIGPGWVVSGGGISRVAIFGTITFSESGSRFIGLRAASITSVNAGLALLSDIIIQRCIIDVSVNAAAEDWENCNIEGCVFSEWNGYNITSANSSVIITASVIRNNVFNGFLYYVTNSDISNNIFLGTGSVIQIAIRWYYQQYFRWKYRGWKDFKFN